MAEQATYNKELIQFALEEFEKYILNLPSEIKQNWGIKENEKIKVYFGLENSFRPYKKDDSAVNLQKAIVIFKAFLCQKFYNLQIDVSEDNGKIEISGPIFKNSKEYLAFYKLLEEEIKNFNSTNTEDIHLKILSGHNHFSLNINDKNLFKNKLATYFIAMGVVKFQQDLPAIFFAPSSAEYRTGNTKIINTSIRRESSVRLIDNKPTIELRTSINDKNLALLNILIGLVYSFHFPNSLTPKMPIIENNSGKKNYLRLLEFSLEEESAKKVLGVLNAVLGEKNAKKLFQEIIQYSINRYESFLIVHANKPKYDYNDIEIEETKNKLKRLKKKLGKLLEEEIPKIEIQKIKPDLLAIIHQYPLNLSGANLSGAYLSGANLSEANLSEANLFKANLSEAYLYEANLSEANLSEANLSEANLSEANLFKANLSEANLSGADLSGANLFKANLSGANLFKANLTWANLSGADLTEADLTKSDLSNANLSGTKFYKANIAKTILFSHQELALTAEELSWRFIGIEGLTVEQIKSLETKQAEKLTEVLRYNNIEITPSSEVKISEPTRQQA